MSAFVARLRNDRRARLAVPLHGNGADLGPGHLPFALPPGARAVLVDRLPSRDHHALFGELQDVPIPEPDVIADLDVDRLRAFPDGSLDFAVASHVLEHLANPFGLLEDVWRVVRPGGLVLVLLPDRRRTFDRVRPPTSPATLLDKWRRDVRHVTDEEIVAFVAETDGVHPSTVSMDTVRLHRARSVHVHCWTDHEFVESLACAFDAGLPPFVLIDGSSSSSDPRLEEFALLLQRPLDRMEEARPGARLRHGWRTIAAGQAADLVPALSSAAAEVVRHTRHLLPVPAVLSALHAVLGRDDLQDAFGPFPERIDAVGFARWLDLVLDEPERDGAAANVAALAAAAASW